MNLEQNLFSRAADDSFSKSPSNVSLLVYLWKLRCNLQLHCLSQLTRETKEKREPVELVRLSLYVSPEATDGPPTTAAARQAH